MTVGIVTLAQTASNPSGHPMSGSSSASSALAFCRPSRMLPTTNPTAAASEACKVLLRKLHVPREATRMASRSGVSVSQASAARPAPAASRTMRSGRATACEIGGGQGPKELALANSNPRSVSAPPAFGVAVTRTSASGSVRENWSVSSGQSHALARWNTANSKSRVIMPLCRTCRMALPTSLLPRPLPPQDPCAG